jgi:ribosomal protein S18 acetylase RimI-like enzyme
MNHAHEIQVRPAVSGDRRGLADLIHDSPIVHRHLDWREPLDWLGSQPYLVAELGGSLTAALACPPDPASIAWLRLFVNAGVLRTEESWRRLWQPAREILCRSPGMSAAAIPLHPGLAAVLAANDFAPCQEIVMLQCDGPDLDRLPEPGALQLRTMFPYDLPQVAEVDAAAFIPLWQNSLEALSHAYLLAASAGVAEKAGRLIGYQLSTRSSQGYHLARLAVRPEEQGQGIGRALVMELFTQAVRHGSSHFTVNTQNDNAASLALYRRLGFFQTGERYPVLVNHVSPEVQG